MSKKQAKRKSRRQKSRTAHEKSLYIVQKLEDTVRLHKAAFGHSAKPFTMNEIAKITGYARSAKLMDHLTYMCDEGFLLLKQKDIKPTGVADVENHFWLPISWADRLEQKKMFEGAS